MSRPATEIRSLTSLRGIAALMVGTGRGAQLGILIRGPQVLESTRRVDTIVLDKTGTLTTGVMEVRGVHPVPGVEVADLLARAGALEAASEHPVGRAVAAAAGVAGTGERLTDFVNHPGRGVAAVLDGVPVLAGRPVFVEGLLGGRQHGRDREAGARQPWPGGVLGEHPGEEHPGTGAGVDLQRGVRRRPSEGGRVRGSIPVFVPWLVRHGPPQR